MGFFEPMAERAGFVAEPAVSFAAEVAPLAAPVAFLAGVLFTADFAVPVAPEAAELTPETAFEGVALAGVEAPLFDGVLPAALFPSFWGVFLGADLRSLSTMLIFDTPSVALCQHACLVDLVCKDP